MQKNIAQQGVMEKKRLDMGLRPLCWVSRRYGVIVLGLYGGMQQLGVCLGDVEGVMHLCGIYAVCGAKQAISFSEVKVHCPFFTGIPAVEGE